MRTKSVLSLYTSCSVHEMYQEKRSGLIYLPVKGHSVVNIFRELSYGQFSVFAFALFQVILYIERILHGGEKI